MLPLTKPRKKKRVTIRQVAKLANVSPTAVSMARANHPQISEETRDRVNQICRELGYEGKRRVPTGRIGFMLLGARMEDSSNASILQEITAAVTRERLRLEISSIDEPSDVVNSADVIDRTVTFAKDLDGLLIMGLVGADLLLALENAEIPTVVVGHAAVESGRLPSKHCVIVAADDVGEAQFATTRLLDCGHRRVGFTCEILYPGLSHARWLAGYGAAHALAGIPLDNRLVQITGEPDGDMERAAKAYADMSDPPTAYVIPDVRVAWLFVHAMQHRGIDIPRDAVIVNANPTVVEQYRMEKYPMILVDLQNQADLAVWHLRALMERKTPCAGELLLPFTDRNLPSATKQKAK